MAPKIVPQFNKDEAVLCFHHDVLYNAKVLDTRQTDDKLSFQYKIHYKGWKSTWDDWVPADRVRKDNEENRELSIQLHEQMRASQQKPSALTSSKGAVGSIKGTPRGSEERHASAAATGRGTRRKEYDLEAEGNFMHRPSVKLSMPDHIKAILVDDWENVTKNQQLVPLPSEHPVNKILEDYVKHEQPKRMAGSARADLLEEVVAGLKEYFDKCLGRVLLYRFERAQYLEARENWNSDKPEWRGKSVGDTYGAEHLCRLLVSLPELIAQTNMDNQSVVRLREELSLFTNWLGRNAAKYFVSEYEQPGAEYIEKARGA